MDGYEGEWIMGKDPYRKTLNLPKTDFPMRANLLQMEPRFQKRWKKLDLFNSLMKKREGAESYVFHDGPPYANGPIHLGHLLNKVLKDFVVRSQSMNHKKVEFVPGWDCHGLPIEHRVMKELGEKARELSISEIRKHCQKYASRFVKLQAKQMIQLGTIGDYDRPYLTMTKGYEAAVLEVFSKLISEGIVYRALKPVHWSIANQTALAEAELEYAEREDTSVYVRFPLQENKALPKSLNSPEKRVDLLIWTTTPWTLPANRAIAVSGSEDYGLYEVEQEAESLHIILGEKLAEEVLSKSSKTKKYKKLGTCKGEELIQAKLRYNHPFLEHAAPIVGADYVTMEDGTGLVHTAPGHGSEDYLTGLKEGLEIYCPVRADGTYDESVPDWIQGKSVWDANEVITERLRESGELYYDHRFNHSYPHDWRSKTPTIFRATEQWFISVDKSLESCGKSLQELAKESVEEKVEFIPKWGKNRLRGMLESRPDWCISRQRSWGLPIPAFHDPDTQEVLLTSASVEAVAAVIRENGSNAWFSMEASELLKNYDPEKDKDAPGFLKGLKSPRDYFTKLLKSKDIFDVWFESGSSWYAVLKQRDIGFPSDLYLEGSDQHRGWFQLSLLPALGVEKQSPYKNLLTHGFMVDAKGKKMSKSLGNTVNVEDLMKEFGADIARWWVSSLNFVNDIKVDWRYFQNAADEYKKIRNTVRFLLGNLTDFDPKTELQKTVEPESLDAWLLNELEGLVKEVRHAYDSFQYRKAHDALFNFCNETLSSVYLSAVKDRLYCEASDSPLRKRTQSTLFQAADKLLRLLGPILVHTADEAFLSLHKKEESSEDSIHFEEFPEQSPVKVAKEWTQMMELRHEVMKELELAKESQQLTNTMDAGAVVQVTKDRLEAFKPFEKELVDLCGLSQFRFEAIEEGSSSSWSIKIEDLREEPRCQRSWKRDGTVKERSDGGLLTDRDAQVMGVS
jgi:isoleucyl-tRNA synthetase